MEKRSIRVGVNIKNINEDNFGAKLNSKRFRVKNFVKFLTWVRTSTPVDIRVL